MDPADAHPVAGGRRPYHLNKSTDHAARSLSRARSEHDGPDQPETRLAAAGVLLGNEPEPGAELVASRELMEVADAGGTCGGAELADADDLCGSLRRRARAYVLAHLAVAPAHVLVELAPVIERALQRSARHRAEFVAGVFDHVCQHGAQDLGALCEDEPEFGQHAADLVDAAGALFLEPLAHPVQAHDALLLASLHRHEAHARA
jgi:hypothetical protein